jgi:hypothetical protein
MGEDEYEKPPRNRNNNDGDELVVLLSQQGIATSGTVFLHQRHLRGVLFVEYTDHVRLLLGRHRRHLRGAVTTDFTERSAHLAGNPTKGKAVGEPVGVEPLPFPRRSNGIRRSSVSPIGHTSGSANRCVSVFLSW